MKHSPEPWSADPEGILAIEIEDGNGNEVGAFYLKPGQEDADCPNADRAVECVNCCAKMENPKRAIGDLLAAARCALADLEGILPEYDLTGESEHPAWKTIEELQAAINQAEVR